MDTYHLRRSADLWCCGSGSILVATCRKEQAADSGSEHFLRISYREVGTGPDALLDESRYEQLQYKLNLPEDGSHKTFG